MKLNVLPANAGAQWVRLGIRTFWRQSLALGSLFILLFLVALVLFTFVPIVGIVVLLALKPTLTVGMMAATREAEGGKAPRPILLFTALRQGTARIRAMIALGLLYAAAIMVVKGIFFFIGNEPLKTISDIGSNNSHLSLAQISAQLDVPLRDPRLITATLTAIALCTLTDLVFWYAPALTHWYNVPVMKSLFFSTVAVLRNMRAFLLYGLSWLCILMGASMALNLLPMVAGSVGVAVSLALQFPLTLIIVAMFTTSQWFTFRDSFVPDAPPPDAPPAMQ